MQILNKIISIIIQSIWLIVSDGVIQLRHTTCNIQVKGSGLRDSYYLIVIHLFVINRVGVKKRTLWNFGNGAVRSERIETMHQRKSCHST